MHSLDNYGDNLRDVRKTVEIVADTESYVEGFKEGRVYNGYRFEYPLFKDEEFIGCVEISMSYSFIFELMDTMFDSPGLFILSKEVVDTKVWDDEKELNYVDCDFSDQYYYDKESYDYFINNEKYTLIANNFLENCEEMDNLKSNLANGDTFIQNINYDNTTYSIVFLKVENVSEENVGYLVFLRENSIYKILLNSIKSKTILIICLWVLFIFFSFKYFKYKAEREKITYFDNLTGALNRNSLFEQITYHLEMYKRYDNKFSIIMFDIDKFKKVNDLKGHMAGDKVLKMVTYITKDNIRITDKIYRYGGDEFLIILPNTEIQYATIVAEKIRKMVDETEFIKIKDFNITLSLGVVECEADIDVDKILIKVDKRLYKAKNSGRNKVVSSC
jgi:diguanylate cyclase (GGDEF)-like protein